MWLHTVLVLSASNICAKVFQTCLGEPESCSSKKMAIFQLPPVNAYPFLTSSKACDWLGYFFGASTSPRPFIIKSWLWHPLPLFMAISMIPNMWHSIFSCMRHSWTTEFGVWCLNQLVHHKEKMLWDKPTPLVLRGVEHNIYYWLQFAYMLLQIAERRRR